MEKKKLDEELNLMREEYKKLSNYNLITVFLLAMTIWAAMHDFWLANGLLILNVFFILLRAHYIRKNIYGK